MSYKIFNNNFVTIVSGVERFDKTELWDKTTAYTHFYDKKSNIAIDILNFLRYNVFEPKEIKKYIFDNYGYRGSTVKLHKYMYQIINAQLNFFDINKNYWSFFGIKFFFSFNGNNIVISTSGITNIRISDYKFKFQPNENWIKSKDGIMSTYIYVMTPYKKPNEPIIPTTIYSFDRFDKSNMKKAFVNAELSVCKRRKVGVTIVRDRRVIADGFNGTISGFSTNECEEIIDDKLVTTPFVIHAEANALDYCAKHGISVKNSTMYITTEPCIECAKRIANSGIKKVIYNSSYRSSDGIKFLETCGVKVLQYQLIKDS